MFDLYAKKIARNFEINKVQLTNGSVTLINLIYSYTVQITNNYVNYF